MIKILSLEMLHAVPAHSLSLIASCKRKKVKMLFKGRVIELASCHDCSNNRSRLCEVFELLPCYSLDEISAEAKALLAISALAK